MLERCGHLMRIYWELELGLGFAQRLSGICWICSWMNFFKPYSARSKRTHDLKKWFLWARLGCLRKANWTTAILAYYGEMRHVRPKSETLEDKWVFRRLPLELQSWITIWRIDTANVLVARNKGTQKVSDSFWKYLLEIILSWYDSHRGTVFVHRKLF